MKPELGGIYKMCRGKRLRTKTGGGEIFTHTVDLGKWIPKRRGNLYYSRIKKKVRVRGKTRKTYDAQESWQNSKMKDIMYHLDRVRRE